jgi:predicted TIM-barrel fold metal-dependent hydrolase
VGRTGSALVDVHVHLYPDEAAGREAKEGYEIWEYGDYPHVEFDTTAGLISDVGDRYDTAGFDHAVVLQLFDVGRERTRLLSQLRGADPAAKRRECEATLEEALASGLMDANRWVLSQVTTHPGLSAYVCIDPVLLTPALIEGHLREMATLGARGVKLHPVSQGYRPDDPRLDVLYRMCTELGLVVLSHSGQGHHGGATARPSEFGAVMERHPELRLVLAHLGGAAWDEAADLAASFPQVLFDLSEIVEWTGAPHAPSRQQLAQVILDIGVDRVMLGSDFPWYGPASTADKVETLPGLGAAARAALLGDTAVARLGLDV